MEKAPLELPPCTDTSDSIQFCDSRVCGKIRNLGPLSVSESAQ